MVRVTVVIAFHRVDDYLKLAVDSIIANSEKDIEVLLIADRLPSEALEILKKSIGDSRIQVLESPGVGAGDARNEGFRLAKGKYIAILDSDDISFPERLKKQADYLDGHPDVVAVGSQVEKITATGDVVGVSAYPERVRRSFLHKPFNGMISNPSSMIRKSSLEAVGGGYRKQFSKTVEDLDLWNRLLRVGKITVLQEVLISYRTHELQNTSVNADEISWHLEIVQLNDIYETYGNGDYNLESLGELSPKVIVSLRSKRARRTLGIRGKVRLAIYDLVHRADENRREEYRNSLVSGLPESAKGVTRTELRVAARSPLSYLITTLHRSRFLSF